MKKIQCLAVLLVASALTVSAQTTYLWTNIVNGYVSNSWVTAANWNPAGPASGAGNTAQFTLPLTNATANNGVIALSSSPTIGNLIFGNTSPSNISWTVNTGSVVNATLTLNASGGTPSISVTNRGVTFNAGVSGAQGFNLSGGGTMQLNAAGTFTGGAGAVAVQAGTLLLGQSSALAGLNTVTVSNTAQLALNASATYPILTNTILVGNGSAGVGSTRGALYLNGNNLSVTWPGPIAVTNGTIGNYGASGTITLPNVISGTNLAFFAGGGATTHVLTINLNTNETYTGSTIFNATFGSSSLVNLNGGANTLPTGTAVTINDTAGTGYYVNLDLHGNNQTVSSLAAASSAGGIVNIISSSGKPTLTMTSTGAGALAFGGATNTINGVNLTVGSGSDNSTDFGGPGATATTVNITNATINSSFYTDVGRAAITTVNLNNGTVFNNTGEILIGYGNTNGIGTLNVNTGAVVSAHFIRVGNNAVSTMNLNAGATVSADEIYSDYTTNCSFYFNGGLLQPHTAPTIPWFAASLTNVQVLAGGALINNGGDNLAVTASLLAGSPNGGLTALGSGTLALQGPNNTYTGSTVISNGTLAVDGNLFVSPVTNFAALAGTGYVAVATLNAGSQLYPGRSNVVGTLSISNLTTLGGSEMYFDLSSSDNSSTDGANDLLQVTNATFGSQTLVGLNFFNGYPVTPANYTVVTYSGSASGLANLALDPQYLNTRAAIGLDAIDYPGQIVVVVTNGNAPITATWYGNNPNNNWDLATTANWDGGGDVFYNQDSVVFDDSAQTNVVNLVGTLYPATVTFNNDASVPYLFTGSGQLGGAVALNLNGNAILTNDVNNINTGGVILNGGNTLQIGNGDTAGTIGSGDVQFLNSSSTLNYNRMDSLTLSNRIYGSASVNPLVQVNSGTLTLAGAKDNAYATATVNSGGTLVLAKSSASTVHALGGGSPGVTPALTINAGGTVRLGGSGGDQIYNGQDVQSDGTFDLAGQSETINNLIGVNGTGLVTNSAAGAAVLSVGGANANVAYNGLLVSGTAGTVGLTAVGTGSVTLTNANTATGPLTLAGSAYVYLSNVTAQAWSGPVVFTNVGVSPRLEFLANQQLSPTSVISFSGTAERRVELNGFTEIIGGLNDLAGVTNNVIVEPATDNTPNEPGTLVLNVAAGVTNSTGGFIRNTAGASGTGSILTLIKTGAGTQIFSGVPGQVSYSGPTTVSNGVLAVSGAGSVLGNSAITLAGGTIDFAGGGTLGNNLSGSGLLQVGGGTLIVTNTPNFTGNTFISAGTLQLGNSTFIGSLASPFITNNGTLYITNSTASTINLTNNLTGSGTLTTLMSASGGQLVLSGNNSGWTGPISMLGNDLQSGSGGWLVVANNTALGSPASRTISLPASASAGAMGIELMGNVSVGTNQTIAIGGRQISGVIYGTNACLQNVSGNNNWAGTLNINGSGGLYALNCLSGQLELSGGMLNTVASSTRGFQLFGAGNYLLDGAITNGSSTALTQIQFSGTGVSVVSGTNNNYSGTTTISSGTVLVTGVIPTNTVTVATNATLGGSGLILGATTIQGGGTLAPGTASIGTLTISNTLILSANSTNIFRLNAAATNNDAVAGLGAVTYGGTLIVTNLNGTLAAGQSFKLFNATTINPATFAAVQLPSLTGSLAWTNTLASNGTIAVVSTFTVATNRVPIMYNVGVGGGTLNLSWPPDHLGWRLLAQTNALATGLSTNWATVPGSTNLTNLVVPITSTNGSVFFELVYP